MNRIDQKFQEGKKLLSIYFSAGHPNLEDTVPVLKELQKAGVDLIEIGLPFQIPCRWSYHTAKLYSSITQWNDNRKTFFSTRKYP